MSVFANFYNEPTFKTNEFLFAQSKSNQIVPEFTVELKGAIIGWAAKEKSSKKNVLEVLK